MNSRQLNLAIFTFGLFAILIFGCKESNDDPRLNRLNQDKKQLTPTPSESDSTATSIKTILSLASMDGFNTDSFEYFTDTTATKALVIVKIPELNSVDQKDRLVFLNLIDKMSSKKSWEGKSKYIGVYGKRNLMLCQTLTKTENKSRVSEKLLLDYYGEKPSSSN